MSKNPVYENLRQRGFEVAAERAVPIIGRKPDPVSGRYWQPPFTYETPTFANEAGLLRTIAACVHPNRVLVDSSVFNESRLDFCRKLLIQTPVVVVPHVATELEDLRRHKSQALQSLVFPDGRMNERLRVDPRWCAGAERTASRYVNQLHIRRRLLEAQLTTFEEKHGRAPKGEERRKIQVAFRNGGISERTIRLSNKGDTRRRYTDEVLAVATVMLPILTGRDVFLLTADYDVFDQFETMTQLVFDDYGSFLIAEDFARRPEFYPHQHPVALRSMENAIAVGRMEEPQYLLPTSMVDATCGMWVIDVRTLEAHVWVANRDVARAFEFQQRVGRVSDDGSGRTVRMSFPGVICNAARWHFVVGKESIVRSVESPHGSVDFTEYEFSRAMQDGPGRTLAKRGRVILPGLPNG